MSTTVVAQIGSVKPAARLSGNVMDSVSRSPVAFVSVGLFAATRVMVSATTTDESGTFYFNNITEGIYQLRFSYVGYANLVIENIKVGADVTQLGTITLHAAGKQLSVVQVTGKKPLVQTMGDKIIYNAAADISNRSGTAADVLRKAPMVTVDPSGNVKMRGSSSIKVLLNGLPSGIMARSLKDALRMMPANSIESVEIITNPSAKYEAEGAAGVINIITRKKVTGTSGNLDLGIGNLERTAGGGLSISRGKFSMNTSLNASREKERNVYDLERSSLDKDKVTGNLLQKGDATETWKGFSADVTADYRPDSTQKIGIGFSYWDGKAPSLSSLYNKLSDNNPAATEYNQQSDQQMKFGSYDLSASYHKKFSRAGQELQLLGQYSRLFDHSSYNTLQSDRSGKNTLSEQGRNRSNNNDFSFQADYAHPLSRSGKHLLETGVRYSDGQAASTYHVFNNRNNPGDASLTEDSTRSNVMNYYQRVFAGYVSLKWETKNNWTFRPGVRFEATETGNRFQGGEAPFKASFTNVVPSLLVLRKLKEQHTFKFGFTQRIRRPGIWDLNPYVNASDPQNLTSGNPALRPEITRTLELGHAFNATSGLTLNSSIYFTKNDNAIESLTTVDNKGVSRTSPRNIGSNQRFGANINATVEPVNGLTINAGAEIFRAQFKSNALEVSNAGNFYLMNLSIGYLLPADFSVEFTGDYSNGEISLQGHTTAYYNYKLAVAKELLNKKANLTLGITNPFQKYQEQKSLIYAASFRSSQTNRFYNRSIVLSFSWRFGGTKPESGTEEKDFQTDKALPRGRKKR